ncbi:MAG: hypothetical protein NXI22_00035 [bacterium]|nr:hypothetical protein [bacterium]
MFTLARNPNLIPDGALTLYTVIAIACLALCFLGYGNGAKTTSFNQHFADEATLFRIAILIGALGTIGFVLLETYRSVIGIEGPWRGIPVYLYTLSKLVLPSLVLIRSLASIFQRHQYLLASFILSLPALIQAVGHGRRTWFFLLVFAWVFPLLLCGRIQLKPSRIIASMLGAFFVFVLLPAYRNELKLRGHSKIAEIIREKPPSEVLEHFFSGEQTLEVRDAVIMTAVADRTKQFSYGALLANGFIHKYVPGGLIGRNLKESLMIPVPNYLSIERSIRYRLGHQGRDVAGYTSKTGFFYVFSEFYWLGPILFYFLGKIFRDLEDRCFDKFDPRAVISMAFIGFLPSALVYSQWSFILPVFAPNFILLLLTLRFGFREPSATNAHAAKVAAYGAK